MFIKRYNISQPLELLPTRHILCYSVFTIEYLVLLFNVDSIVIFFLNVIVFNVSCLDLICCVFNVLIFNSTFLHAHVSQRQISASCMQKVDNKV